MVSTRSNKTTDGKDPHSNKRNHEDSPNKLEESEETAIKREEEEEGKGLEGKAATGRKRAASTLDDDSATPDQPAKVQRTGELKQENEEQNEVKEPTTPGRVGPVLHEDVFLPSPDIKPFKGEKGHKVRKTVYEKEEEYTQHIRDNPTHPFHQLHVCCDKGPNGSPTYDHQGFELSYDKVKEWMRPKAYNKEKIMRDVEKSDKARDQETKEMAAYFFDDGKIPTNSSMTKDYWRDRVSKYLNIPWHRIGAEHFKQWADKGFSKAKVSDFNNISDSQSKRMLNMHKGSALRK